jgi:TolB-like protein/DNA-binding winged helix-turn-helix (wHTH) protein/Tfp pilus assembly protein PilF
VANRHEVFRFRDFELDVTAYELRRQGRRVRLERRPMDLLIFMVQRRGELITRADIVDRLWGPDVFIEVETAVNTLVRKIRQALGDASDAPAFVETVAGKGYRFIAEVEAPSPLPPIAVDAAPAANAKASRSWQSIAVVAALVVAALGLWAWNASQPSAGHVRLAVLPFETIGIDAARGYLADALHEETIAALGQIDPEHIEVITRTSMLPYKGSTKALEQIARELQVEYLVGSAVSTENDRIRVTAKLIRARDLTQVWSWSYDNEPRSILDFQRDLSARIAEQIRHRLSPDRLTALARRHTSNPEAFQLYLQGLAAWNQLTPPQSTARAIEHYTRATRLDPGYALPWAGLALAYAGAPINGDADPRAVGPLARQSAERAVAADPHLAESQTAIGAVKFWFDWEWTHAEQQFRNAIAADPGYAFGQRMVGIVLSHQARHGEANAHMNRLVEIEPAYEMNWALRAQVAYNAREYPAAVEFATRAIALQPNFWIAHYHLAMANERQGRHDLALQTLARSRNGPANSKLLSLQGYLLGKLGRHDDARAVLQTFDQLSRDQRYVPPYARALVFNGLGDRPAALDWLDRAYAERDVHLIALPTDPKWDAYRDDPRFIALMNRCGFVKSQS